MKEIIFFENKFKIYVENDNNDIFFFNKAENPLPKEISEDFLNKKIEVKCEKFSRKIYQINDKGKQINIAFENEFINEAMGDLTNQLHRYRKKYLEKIDELCKYKKELDEIKSHKFWYKIYKLLKEFKWKLKKLRKK